MNLRRLLSLSLLVCQLAVASITAQDAFQGILPVTDPAMKRSLNGTWNLKVVEGIVNDLAVPAIDDTWREIPVPGCWEAHGFCQPSYDRALPLTGYYRTSFTVPAEWQGKRIVIRFDGVLYGYDLWINGRQAGSWRSAYNTAMFDITDLLCGGNEQLAMRVISQFPGSDFDYNDDWAPNGIFRDVTLMAVPATHLADLTIHTRNTGEVTIDTRVANANKHTTVTYEIISPSLHRGVVNNEVAKDANKSKTYHTTSKLVSSPTHGERLVVGRIGVDNPLLWSSETPYLYTLRTTLKQRGKTLQTFEHKFGFRELTIEGNVLKLNGQPIKLRGVTSHATDPRTIKVISDELTLKDMRLMKEASVNYIRTSHYPREPRFYELADSLGFYIIDEVPFGYGDKNLSDTTFYPVLQQRAQATIRRDKNHPSVLIWSLGNENPLTDICIQLGHYVKSELDPSRPICYPQIGSYFRKFNYDFPKVADIYAPHYPSTSQIATFYQHADRPVIFTEYLHTLGISFEDHDRQWELIERTPGIAGGSIWEWVDQGCEMISDSLPTFSYKDSFTPDYTESKSTSSNNYYGYQEHVILNPQSPLHSEGKGAGTHYYSMQGSKGTDGLLYADRTPLPNYYELQHNYAQAAITDSIITLREGQDTIFLHIRNRFDFLNLKDNITFHWTITADRDTVDSGTFSPYCPPHNTISHPFILPALPDTSIICLLNIEISDHHSRIFNRQSIPFVRNGSRLKALRLAAASTPSEREVDYPLFIRCGRKPTLAETLKVADKRIEKYIQPLSADGTKAGTIHTHITTEAVGDGIHYTFALTPDSSDTFLSELGLAFLLDPHIDRVQWIGNGPMPTYPGRFRAGRYGFWAMQQGDLYFEGNRRGVDAAWLTDANGNGVLLVCDNADVSFEQTDRGIILTYNAAVSGQGPKFARTAFPVIARNVGTVSGDFYLYPTQAGNTPYPLRRLFLNPANIPAPFRPFATQYDTYLMPLSSILAPAP